jgi:hypothetical protein
MQQSDVMIRVKGSASLSANQLFFKNFGDKQVPACWLRGWVSRKAKRRV